MMVKGSRVRLIQEYSNLPVGSEGTVTFDLSGIERVPFVARVKFDATPEPKPGDLIWGMDDLGWLMLPTEIEEI